MEAEGSLPSSQEPSICPYSEPDQSNLSSPISLRSILMWIHTCMYDYKINIFFTQELLLFLIFFLSFSVSDVAGRRPVPFLHPFRSVLEIRIEDYAHANWKRAVWDCVVKNTFLSRRGGYKCILTYRWDKNSKGNVFQLRGITSTLIIKIRVFWDVMLSNLVHIKLHASYPWDFKEWERQIHSCYSLCYNKCDEIEFLPSCSNYIISCEIMPIK
jgi:hypothetical protein